MFTHQLSIESEHIEPDYEHVHHAQALRFLEEARMHYLESVGYPLQKFIQEGLFLVITVAHVCYLRELFCGLHTVTCEAPTIVRRRLSIQQRILKENGKAAVEAEMEFMCLSREKMRAVHPPKDFCAAFLQGACD